MNPIMKPLTVDPLSKSVYTFMTMAKQSKANRYIYEQLADKKIVTVFVPSSNVKVADAQGKQAFPNVVSMMKLQDKKAAHILEHGNADDFKMDSVDSMYPTFLIKKRLGQKPFPGTDPNAKDAPKALTLFLEGDLGKNPNVI